MKYVQILASTLAFVAAAALLVQMRQQQEHLYLFVILFLLCGANLLSRLTETSINDQIVEAEEKVAKRVLRRLAKVMPELLNEYFKAGAAQLDEKPSDVIVAPLVERDAKGNTVVTVPPGCTAADVNAAVGATIAHSISRPSASTPWPCWQDVGPGHQKAVGLCSQCTGPAKCADAKDCALGLIKI